MPGPPLSGFSRRFRELVAGEAQGDVGRRLGYTGGRIGQILRGERPSREFIERLIQAYSLDRDEWLALAGYGGPAPVDERQAIAEAAAREALRQIGQDPAAAILDAATREPLEYDADLEHLKVEQRTGDDDLTPSDLEILNRAVRILRTEQRRQKMAE